MAHGEKPGEGKIDTDLRDIFKKWNVWILSESGFKFAK